MTTVQGGTQLVVNGRLARIEPYGVVRIAQNSTHPTVSEMDGKVGYKLVKYCV